jgi:hypothetical protein
MTGMEGYGWVKNMERSKNDKGINRIKERRKTKMNNDRTNK